jgi:hypothetical protein
VSFIVCGQGMQMLVLYGWPGHAVQNADKCRLHKDIPIKIPVTPGDIVTFTTDRDTGDRAFYSLRVSSHPIVFHDEESAQYVIDRFQIPDAKPVPWRGL